MSEKIDLEKYAEQQLLEANLPTKFSYRRAYLLGRQDAFRKIEEKEIKIEPFKTTSPP